MDLIEKSPLLATKTVGELLDEHINRHKDELAVLCMARSNLTREQLALPVMEAVPIVQGAVSDARYLITPIQLQQELQNGAN